MGDLKNPRYRHTPGPEVGHAEQQRTLANRLGSDRRGMPPVPTALERFEGRFGPKISALSLKQTGR